MRRFTTFITVMCLSISLASCGQAKPQSNPDNTPTDSAEQTPTTTASPLDTSNTEDTVELSPAEDSDDFLGIEGQPIGILVDKAPLSITQHGEGTICQVKSDTPLRGVIKDPEGKIVGTARSVFGLWNPEKNTCRIGIRGDKDPLTEKMDFYTMEVTLPDGTTLNGTSSTPVIDLGQVP